MKFSWFNSREQGHEQILAEFEAAGFFSGLSDSEAAAARSEIREHGRGGLYTEPRFLHADAEDLAEGGVDEFLRRAEPFLRRQGVPDLVIVPDLSDEYAISVNGATKVILTVEDMETRPDASWGLAAGRTVLLVNELLEAAGSRERAYGMYGGNDFSVFFLTPELKSLFEQQPGLKDHDRPYVVDEQLVASIEQKAGEESA
jgi:hypothetical protein